METKLLDLPISFFEYDHQRGTFANTPSQQTTLRRIVLTRYYQALVEAICAEPDRAKQDELKKRLPSFTPVALLRHRKKDTSFKEKIINQWPMGMGDIDKKDNPGVDMAELKHYISQLPFVLLCAYSVRRGLWFVVRLPDNQTTDTLAAHFRYLQRLFTEKFGIKLDSTKGGNPTALRFVSCDTEPYFNDEAIVMEGIYTPPPPKSSRVSFDQPIDEDSGKLLKRLLKPVQNVGQGQRHETLLKAAKLAGGFIAANRLDEQTAVLALETIVSKWPMFSKSQKTIRDGISYGKTVPIYPDVRERPVAWKVETKKSKVSADTKKETSQPEVYRDEAWKPFDYVVKAEEVLPIKGTISIEVGIVEKPELTESKPTPFRLPQLIETYWLAFIRPPFWYNKIRVHKALLRCLNPNLPREVVATVNEQYNSPGSILRPTETQLKREPEIVCNDYPCELDHPNQLSAAPRINPLTFIDWKRKYLPFNQMGIDSLQSNQ